MQLRIKILAILMVVISVSSQEFGRLKLSDPKKNTPDEMTTEAYTAQQTVALENVLNPDTYVLGPGDIMGINILAQEAVSLSLKISPTGHLLIPAAGKCFIAGQTISEGIQTIRDFIQSNAFPNAEFHVALLGTRQFKLVVTGAVNKPGYVVVTPMTRLSEIIEKVDGFRQLATEFAIEVQDANGLKTVVNYNHFLLTGELSANPTFSEGASIHIPFGDINKSGIVVRGAVSGVGYDIIEPQETLALFIQRQVSFRNETDLENVIIHKKTGDKSSLNVIPPQNFATTILTAGDELNFLRERGITLTGFVQMPGGFSFLPGYSVMDYIALAGGNTLLGDPNAAVVTHLDGSIERGRQVVLLRGDVIFVPRTRTAVIFGNSSVLQTFSAIASIVLAYIATTK